VDKDVAKAIRETLSGNPVLRMASRDASFIIMKGVVTLKGKVADESQRSAIVESISKLPGVDRVIDQLSIVPP
jgi:osmotically-inducible protein OsmY